MTTHERPFGRHLEDWVVVADRKLEMLIERDTFLAWMQQHVIDA